MKKPFEKEIFQVAGDPPTPDYKPKNGVMPGYNLTNTATAKPVVLWQDRLLTLDLYTLPNAPAYLHLICPKCHNALKVSQDRKTFSFSANELPKKIAKKTGLQYSELAADLGLTSIDQLRGVISIHDPIQCTWETEPELRRTHDAICNWRVVIEDNIARDV
ncbi:MAG: hypothetical protein Q8S00_32630 [Deltaproteobacteria bacterium]|nr:hypothetical protein [Deltaproteobacteria bacterium]